MPQIVNPEFMVAANRGYSAAFRDALVGHTENTFEQITQQLPMDSEIIDLPALGSIRGLRKWTGDRQFQSLKATGYQMVSEIFEDSIEVPRKAIEDDRWRLWVDGPRALGRKTAEFPDQLVYQKLERGETEVGIDEVPFFSASHPIGNTGLTFSNLSGTNNPPWYLFDTSHIEKPMLLGNHGSPLFEDSDESLFQKDVYQYGVRVRKGVQFGVHHLAYKSKAALDATTFNAAYSTMMQYRDEHGESLGVIPRILMVPPVLRSAALALLETQYIGGNSNPNFGIVKLVINHRLTNSNVV